MEKMNALTLIITLVVGVILTGALLGPVINDATKTTETFTNTGYLRLGEISSEDPDTYTITWTYENPHQFIVNDEIYTMPDGNTTGSVFPYTMFATDGWGLRYTQTGGNVDLNLYGSGENSQLLWYATTTDTNTVTITINGGTASFVKNGGSAVNMTYTNMFIPDNDGEFILKKGNSPAYLNSESVIYSTGRTSASFGANAFAININLNGNVEGVNVNVLAPSGFTSSNVVIDSSEVDGYENLYSFNKVTFDITQDSTSITVGATYAQVIVPYQVTAELSEHLTPGQISLMGAIPVMVIVALLMAAVGAIALGRND